MPNPTATIFIPYHALDDLLRIGTRAAQPAASAVTPGTLYAVTDEANRVERSDGTTWALYAGSGGGGGAPAAHHATHEPGGSDALVALDGTVLTTGTVNIARLPTVLARQDQLNTFTAAWQRLYGNLHLGPAGNEYSFLNWDAGNQELNVKVHRADNAEIDVASFRLNGDTVARRDEIVVRNLIVLGTSGSIGGQPIVVTNDARLTDARTPTAHAATHAAGGSDPLVLAPYYDYREGTPANPAADTIRLYAVDDSGFTFLEERDAAGRIIRTSRDTVAVGKVDEAGGITRGQCVYVSGASGSNRLLKKALATSRTTTPAFGLAMESGAQNAFIRVLTSGLLPTLDTSAIAEGTRVFLSETTPGGLTVTAPVAPNLVQRVGWVLRSHATQGEIGVLPATALSEASWVTTHASMHAAGGRDPLAVTTLTGYAESTWTVGDASGQGLSIAAQEPAYYVKQGNWFCGSFYIQFPTTANANQVILGGLPFGTVGSSPQGGSIAFTTKTVPFTLYLTGTSIYLRDFGANPLTWANMSGTLLAATLTFRINS